MAYDDIAEELSGDMSMEDLDPGVVRIAQEYAKRAHRKWPPKPQVTGLQVQIWSIP